MSVQLDLITYEIELDIDTSGNITLNLVDGKFVSVFLNGTKLGNTKELDFRNGNGTTAVVTLSNGRSLVSHKLGGTFTEDTIILDDGTHYLQIGDPNDYTRSLRGIQIMAGFQNSGTGFVQLGVVGTASDLFMSQGAVRLGAETTLSFASANWTGYKVVTTVGANLLSLTNPSAVTWARINADNTVTAQQFFDTINQLLQTVTASGTDTYTATLNPSIASYPTNLKVSILFTNANTGAATLNLNGLGAKSIKKSGNTALSSGDISAGQILFLIYDGTNFQVVGGGGSSSGGGHTIQQNGTSVTQRTNLNFSGDVIIDDSSSNATTVNNVGSKLYLFNSY